MLVLSRKAGEQVIVDGGIRVQVLAIEGNRVRLGFEAPETCSILRGELVQADQEAVERARSAESRDRGPFANVCP